MPAVKMPAIVHTVTRRDSEYARNRSNLVVIFPALLPSYRANEWETQTRLAPRHPDLGGGGDCRILSVKPDRAGGAPLGGSAGHHGASPAAHRVLGPPQALHEAPAVGAARAHRSRPATRRHRGRGWALLPAPRDRLEGGAEGGGQGRGRRAAGPRRFHHHAATGEEPVLHHQPERAAQSRGVHAGAAGGMGAAQEAHPGTVSERDRMGPGCLRSGSGGAKLVRPSGGQGESRSGGAVGGRDSLTLAPQACAHERLQRRDSPPYGADGLVGWGRRFRRRFRLPTNYNHGYLFIIMGIFR